MPILKSEYVSFTFIWSSSGGGIAEEEVGKVGSQILRGSGGDWVANSRLIGNYKGKEYIQWLGKEYV